LAELKKGVVGVDLAGSPKRVTGLCYLDPALRCSATRARSDEEILSFVRRFDPRVVAVDAPLSSPPPGESMRKCDRDLKRMGLRPLPPVLGGMRMLTERAVKLKDSLSGLGYEVIEVFPRGAQKILGLPSKKDRRGLRAGLASLGLKGIPEDADIHVLDAATCALVGLLYLREAYVAVGEPGEGVIVMPRSPERWSSR